MRAVRDKNGDVTNELEVKGEYILQFGICRGKSFKWALENAMGYVGWLVNSMSGETTTSAAISQNKGAFRKYRYVLSFDEGREAVTMKKSEMGADRKTNHETSSASKPAPPPMVSRLPSRMLASYKASSS